MNEFISIDGNFTTDDDGDVQSTFEGVNAPLMHQPEGYDPDDTPRSHTFNSTDTTTINGIEYGDSLANETTPAERVAAIKDEAKLKPEHYKYIDPATIGGTALHDSYINRKN